jgi:methylated-DNA-protein-cysteine methyltransferase related protein
MSTPHLPDFPLFCRWVWSIVQQVPAGRVTTFGQIASMISPPNGVDPADYAKLGARWVGDAMNAVSFVDEPSVPWHRVINAKGMISLPDNTQAAALQRARLRDDGIEFDDRERIDLNVFGWDGADPRWAREHGFLPAKAIRAKPDDSPSQLSLF